MIASPYILASYAKEAGMDIPDDPDRYEQEKETFPHFFVFCALQLGAPMPSPTAGWDNAKVIAAIPRDDIKMIRAADIYDKGFVVGFSS